MSISRRRGICSNSIVIIPVHRVLPNGITAVVFLALHGLGDVAAVHGWQGGPPGGRHGGDWQHAQQGNGELDMQLGSSTTTVQLFIRLPRIRIILEQASIHSCTKVCIVQKYL